MKTFAKHTRELAREHWPADLLEDNPARCELALKLRYDDYRGRVELDIRRFATTMVDDQIVGRAGSLFGTYNTTLDLSAVLPRQPYPKAAAQWVARFNEQLETIVAIALASESPDWTEIGAMFAHIAGGETVPDQPPTHPA